MRRRFRSSTPLLWVLALGFLVVRIANPHVHLCFDGDEPPISLHVSDRGVVCHTDDESEGSDQDQDVDVAAVGAALTKKDAQYPTIDPDPIADIVLSLSAPPTSSVARPITLAAPAVNRPYLHLPQLRGPPL